MKRFFLPIRKIFVVNFKMALTSLKCAQSPEMRTESGNANGVRKCARSPEMRTESGNGSYVPKMRTESGNVVQCSFDELPVPRPVAVVTMH